jgi:DNA-binding beta-propeller fold protein YncE
VHERLRSTGVLLLLAGALGARAEELVVVEKGAERLAGYDTATGRALWSVPVGTKPHEFAVSRDGKTAWVSNYGVDSFADKGTGGNTLSVVDLVRHGPAGLIDLGEIHRPHFIHVGASGRLYVTTDEPAGLVVLDPVKRAVVRHYPVGQSLPHMLAVSADEKRGFTANTGSGTVSVIALDADVPVRQVEIGGLPQGFAWSRDAKRLFVCNRAGDAVLALDPATGAIESRTTITGHPHRLSLLPDGRRLLASAIESGDVIVIDTASLREVTRFRVGKRADGVNVDAAGKFGYVAVQDEDKVVKFSLADWKPVLEIKTRAKPDPVAVLPAAARGGVSTSTSPRR